MKGVANVIPFVLEYADMTVCNKKKRIIISVIVAVAIVAIAVFLVFKLTAGSSDLTKEDAVSLLKDGIDSAISKDSEIARNISKTTVYTVNSVDGNDTLCEADVAVEYYDIGSEIVKNMEAIVALEEGTADGKPLKSDAVKSIIREYASEWQKNAEKKTENIKAIFTKTGGKWQLYKSREIVNLSVGGIVDVYESIEKSEIKAQKRLASLILVRYETNEPDTRTSFEKAWDDLKAEFKLNFIDEARWKMILDGFLNTLKITFVSLIIGILIGIIVAAVRSSFDKNGEEMKKRGGIGYYIISFFNVICKIYITLIRGTPVVVQLLIYYFIIFVSIKDGTVVAMLAFGFNSGAYVAEIFRGGIMSIDQGQFEAGRSLGFNYVSTMRYVIIPQVFKTVLPTLCNEFITLLKETSIAGYVGIVDLTKAGDLIRGRTFSAFMPLIAVALVYLVCVVVLTYLVGRLERRLRRSER